MPQKVSVHNSFVGVRIYKYVAYLYIYIYILSQKRCPFTILTPTNETNKERNESRRRVSTTKGQLAGRGMVGMGMVGLVTPWHVVCTAAV